MFIVSMLVASCILLVCTATTGSAKKKVITYYYIDGAYRDYDLNMDGEVDGLDVSILVYAYGSTGEPGWIRADINKDGDVNYLDVSSLVYHYGESYTPEKITVQTAITTLRNYINSANIPRNLKTQMVQKLTQAITALDNNNPASAKTKLNQVLDSLQKNKAVAVDSIVAEKIINDIQVMLAVLP
ncbi:MAG: hypothetical protein JXA00_00580 [Candidatus Thermoplasmatota archaeon]|nr:hypothetical protein [Candidatus Thermoplasmatota archaeon]